MNKGLTKNLLQTIGGVLALIGFRDGKCLPIMDMKKA